ncbi:MAG: hypothetical protein R3C99_18940 [Pirellulaceae bacterium]
MVARLLTKDPRERYASAEEVAELLEHCLAHWQQPTRVPLPPELRASRRRRLWIGGGGVGRVSSFRGDRRLDRVGTIVAVGQLGRRGVKRSRRRHSSQRSGRGRFQKLAMPRQSARAEFGGRQRRQLGRRRR